MYHLMALHTIFRQVNCGHLVAFASRPTQGVHADEHAVSVLGEKTVYDLLELTGMLIPKASQITLQVLLVLLTKAVIKLANRCVSSNI